MTKMKEQELIDLAVNGNREALEVLLLSIQDMIYNMSLRMLGSPSDAEDSSQEIMLHIITHLSTFRKESAFSTWAFRIAKNYLINYKKSFFATHPLSFEFYGEDIEKGFIENHPELLNNIDENILSEELKLSCTNVMLQCLDQESRCIYILGTMFHLDSRIAGEILDLTPEAYRQKLSRVRKKMADFLKSYCGLMGGKCCCKKRIGYAVTNHRLNPVKLEYNELPILNEDILRDGKESMERLDEVSLMFANMPKYKSSPKIIEYIHHIIASGDIQNVINLNSKQEGRLTS